MKEALAHGQVYGILDLGYVDPEAVAVTAQALVDGGIDVLQLRAKGFSEWRTIYGHVLKNALIPVVTILGLQLGAFLGGAVVTESIFDWPGMGRLLLQAIGTRDYPVLQGTILFIVVAFVLVNLITDLTYGFLDPRIRYE